MSPLSTSAVASNGKLTGERDWGQLSLTIWQAGPSTRHSTHTCARLRPSFCALPIKPTGGQLLTTSRQYVSLPPTL